MDTLHYTYNRGYLFPTTEERSPLIINDHLSRELSNELLLMELEQLFKKIIEARDSSLNCLH